MNEPPNNREIEVDACERLETSISLAVTQQWLRPEAGLSFALRVVSSGPPAAW
jgi:hypothetical protein